jgi:hypothetical protein
MGLFSTRNPGVFFCWYLETFQAKLLRDLHIPENFSVFNINLNFNIAKQTGLLV